MINKEESGPKVRLDVELVKDLIDRISQINSYDIEQIDWYKDGIKLNIPEELINEFKFTGLSNKEFIGLNYYE